MKRIIPALAILALLIGVCGGQIAHAQNSVVFSITGNEGGSPFWGDVNDCALNACGWGDTWTPTTAYNGAQICGVSTRIVNGTGMTGQLTMNVYTPFSFFAAANPLIPVANAQSLLLLGSATVDISTLPVGLGATDPGVQPTVFDFGSCFTITSGNQYIFQLTSNSTDPRGLLIALSDTIQDPSVQGTVDGGGWQNQSGNPAQTEMNFLGIPASGISFAFPQNGATVDDFDNWSIQTNNVSDGNLVIQYSPVNGAGSTGTDTISYSPFVNVNPVPVAKSLPLFFPPLLPPVEYVATATLYNFDGSIQAQANDDFFVNPLGTGETSSSIPTTVNCQITSSSFFADPIGNIQNGICNALTFLFIPNSAQQQDMNNGFQISWSQISNRVPFGYAGIIFTALQSFQEGNSSSTLMATTTYVALAAVFDPLKTGIAFLLILLFAFWIFKFIQHIQL
ncbi:MAG TPA: hypothetical protein VMT81_02670 [Candidatus Paceibacterota bacterium]|nr:hypothetical protein [Candidatus Paceibacterota bacterium]